MTLKYLAATMVISITTACTNTNSKVAENAGEMYGMRVYFGECLFAGEAGGLDVVASALISNTLDRFGSALRKLGEKDTYTDSAYRNFESLGENQKACIQVVKGTFGLPTKLVKMGPGPKENQVSLPVAINLTASPVFFAEFTLVKSENNQFLILQPTFIAYEKLIKDGSKSTAARGLAFQFSFHPAGKPADDSAAVGTTLDLGALSVGEDYDFTHHQHKFDPSALQSPWFPSFYSGNAQFLPHDPNEAETAGQSVQPVDSMPIAGNSVPMTLTVSVAETRAERPSLLFLADVFDNSKEAVQAELEILVIKEKREEQQTKIETAKLQAQLDYQTKLADAKTQEIAYCALPNGPSTTEKQARLSGAKTYYLAQMAANIAAVTIGEPRPYPSPVVISELPTNDGDDGSNPCPQAAS